MMTKLPSKRFKKHNSKVRLFLFLMDMEEHKFDEFYDWVAENVSSNIASRACARNWSDPLELNLDAKVIEGRRSILLQVLKNQERLGRISIKWPEKELKRSLRSKGYTEIRKCVLKLTDVGLKHIFESRGLFGAIASQVYAGLFTKRIGVNFKYLGNPEVYDEVQENNLELVVIGNEIHHGEDNNGQI